MENRTPRAKLEDIARKYGLQLNRFKPVDSLYKKNAVYRASTDQGKFMMKAFYSRSVYVKRTQQQQSMRVASYIQRLKKNGYPHLPNWLTTSSGQYFVHKDGKPYYMTEWIEGRSLQHDCQDYEALGSALANLHTIGMDRLTAKSSFTRKQIKLFQNQDRFFRKRLTGIRQKDTAVGKWFQKHGVRCKQLAEEAWNMIGRQEVAELLAEEINLPALIHGDVTVPNTIIHASGLYLIDWDSLRLGSTYYEIAKTLANTTGFNPVFIQAMLKGYETIKPLNPSERLLIGALFRLPREAWSEARKFVMGRRGRDFQVLKQGWEDRLNAVRWMDDWVCQPQPAMEEPSEDPNMLTTEIR